MLNNEEIYKAYKKHNKIYDKITSIRKTILDIYKLKEYEDTLNYLDEFQEIIKEYEEKNSN